MTRYLLLAVSLFVISCVCSAQKIPLIHSGEVLKEGKASYDSGNYERAIHRFLTIPERDTNYIPMLAELAMAYNGAKDYDKSISICEKALEKPTPYKAHLLRTKAIALDKKGNYKESVALFEKAIEAYPSDFILIFNLGITHYNNKAYDKAKECFFRALSINPFHAGSHLNLGNASMGEGRKVHAMLSYGMYLSIANADNARLVLLEKFLTNQVPEEGSFTPTGDNAFEKLDQIVRAKMAMDKNFKTKVPLDAGVSRQFEMLFEQIDLYSSDVNDPWVKFYLPVYKAIKNQKAIEPFIYHILSSWDNEQVKKWRKKNDKLTDNFFTLANTELKKNRVNPVVSASLGVDPNVTGWYGDDKKMVSVGNKDSNGKRIGRWVFFYDNAERSAEGSYGNEEAKVGIWKYYHTDGTLSREENYNTGEVNSYFNTGTKFQHYTLQNDKVNGDVEINFACGALKEKLGYKDGKAHGPGVVYHPNGKVHKKYQHIDGKLDGEYITYFTNGQVESKYTYKEEKLHGPSTTYFINGKVAKTGAYQNDELEGVWKYYYSNGNLSRTGNYKQGIGTGEWTFHNEKGELIERRNFNESGKLHGDNTFYDRGRVHFVQTFKNDLLVKVVYYDVNGKELGQFGKPDGTFASKTFFATGQLSGEGAFKKGELHGPWKYYHRHGSLLSEFNYVDGKLQGEGKEYYRSGAIKSIAQYKDNKLDGYYQEFYVHGKVKMEGWYKNGEQQQQWLSHSVDGVIESDDYYLDGQIVEASYGYNDDAKLYSQVNYGKNGLIDNIQHFDSKAKLRTKSTLKGGATVYETVYANKKVQSRSELLCGEYSGQIARWFPDGKVFYSYTMDRGKRDGKYQYYYPSNVLQTEGHYVNGLAEGVWRGFYENGKPDYAGKYLNGDYDSTWTYYYPNGKISQTAEFFRDRRHGFTKFFSPEGTPAIEKIYDKGDLISYREMLATGSWGEWKTFNGNAVINSFYANGQKSFEEEYKNSELNGFRKIYFSTGKVYSEVPYVNGDYHGKFVFYHANGKVRKKGEYRFDQYQGKVELFDEEGLPLLTEEFTNGTRNGKVIVYSKGTKVKDYNFWGGQADD